MTTMDLPGGWHLHPIGLIAIPKLGGNYRNSSTPSGRPLIKMGNIARVNIDLKRLEYIPNNEKVLPEHCLHYGDVLFNTRNTLDLVGKVSIWRDELPTAYYNSNILRLEFKDEYCGSSSYFGYALNSKSSIEAIRALATGTTSVAAVYTRDLLKLQILVPPKPEQVYIASALTDIDNLINALEHLIATKQAIKQGMMQQLLTGRTRLPKFAGEWKRAQLSTVGVVVTGGTPPTRDRSNYGWDHMFVSPADLGRSKNVTTTEKMLSKSGFARTRRIPAGSTLFVCIGSTIGKVGLAAEDLATNQQINSIIPSDGIDPDYLYYAANTLSSVVREQAGAQAVPLVNKSQFSAFEILLPTLPEQRAIAEVLSDADAQIAQLRAKLDKATSMKTGMMQELLTGRTRLSEQRP